MEKNKYTDALKNAESEYIKCTSYMLFYIAMSIAVIVMCVFLVISFLIHWFTNDSLTSMQALKWSLSRYWWMYVVIVVQRFIPSNKKDWEKSCTKYNKLKKLSEETNNGQDMQ